MTILHPIQAHHVNSKEFTCWIPHLLHFLFDDWFASEAKRGRKSNVERKGYSYEVINMLLAIMCLPRKSIIEASQFYSY